MNSPATRAVRRATPDDAPTLARFRHAFRSSRHPVSEPESEFLARCTHWMRPRLGTDSRWRVWLLEQNEKTGREAIGNIWLQMIEKIPNPGTESELYGYISNFFVVPPHRNTGAGTMLLRSALDECRRFHAGAVFLWPSEESRPLYERHGFAVAERM
ncbi:MAG TPA: GNAT family N-acetyltransferase, partial [Gemmatimonadaceae bacterium]|nr:GNAT family N-acetyltransferase [Gemmatimonadaceae bacterium]